MEKSLTRTGEDMETVFFPFGKKNDTVLIAELNLSAFRETRVSCGLHAHFRTRVI